jgi:HAD superfamily hydrolase (TIGR01458 family)
MVEGLLLDMDGVLTISWEPLPGAIVALDRVRAEGLPFRIVTNTTTHARAELAASLRDAGLPVEVDEIVTAVVGTGTYLRSRRPHAGVFVLSDGDAVADMEGVRLVDLDEADVVVVGGACDEFSYDALNRIFRRITGGAELVAMHRNYYWRTSEGLQLDGGAFVEALEAAAGVRATVCGKPSPEFFASALSSLGARAEDVVMVGDDIENDVLAAQAVGLIGVLVRTGKFVEQDLARGTADHVIDSIADLPDLLARA